MSAEIFPTIPRYFGVDVDLSLVERTTPTQSPCDGCGSSVIEAPVDYQHTTPEAIFRAPRLPGYRCSAASLEACGIEYLDTTVRDLFLSNVADKLSSRGDTALRKALDSIGANPKDFTVISPMPPLIQG